MLLRIGLEKGPGKTKADEGGKRDFGKERKRGSPP